MDRDILTSLFSLVLVAASTACSGSATSGTETTGAEPAESSGGAEPEAGPTVESGSIEAAIAGAHRSEPNRARDRYRHPRETLEFFGLEPGMNVVEMAPGGGWYTEILAPVVRGQGSLTLAVPDPNQSQYTQRLLTRLQATPQVYDHVRHVVFALPDNTELGPPGSADMVVTFRSTHGWINGGGARQVFEAMFAVLRPGGVLGVVQHRADDDADATQSARSGYVPEPYVVQLAQDVGFELEERSDINRNEADTHDHPRGVWTLPPSYRLGEEDRARYEAIGESDRMTLRFRKPQAASEAPATTTEE